MTTLKFASIDDVVGRFEGDIPDDRSDWVELRIFDVENELMGKVPSLRKPLGDIQSDSVAAGDPGRVNRVATLVCNKVLDLYRNPEGFSQKSQAMGDMTSSTSYYRDVSRGSISFTADELESVRLRTKRAKFGTVQVVPFDGHH